MIFPGYKEKQLLVLSPPTPVQEALSQHAVFSSASSQLPQLDDALRDAATRAMEGMLGKGWVRAIDPRLV